MPAVTIVMGVLLVLMGIGGYLGTGRESVTALIPAFVGIVLAAMGAWAKSSPSKLKVAMHIAVVVALVGALGAARGLKSLPAVLSGDEVERPAAVWIQTAMFALCVVFLVLAVRSFVLARRQS